MGVQFLSAEWAQAANRAIGRQAEPTSATAEDLSLQFGVKEAPAGSEARYYVRIRDGSASIEIGTVDKPDVAVTVDYATACAISKGEMNIQTAFFSGKLTVDGNIAKLITQQRHIASLADAVSSVDIDY